RKSNCMVQTALQRRTTHDFRCYRECRVAVSARIGWPKRLFIGTWGGHGRFVLLSGCKRVDCGDRCARFWHASKDDLVAKQSQHVARLSWDALYRHPRSGAVGHLTIGDRLGGHSTNGYLLHVEKYGVA